MDAVSASTSSRSASEAQGEPPSPAAVVPASDPGEVGRALDNAAPGDDLATAAKEGSISAGEAGRAVDDHASRTNSSDVEVVIGAIPDPDDLTVMRWTARCSYEGHDLLGYFESEQDARDAKDAHLASEH